LRFSLCFDQIRHEDEQSEWWSARELAEKLRLLQSLLTAWYDSPQISLTPFFASEPYPFCVRIS